MHSNGIRGELAFYFFAPLSISFPFFLCALSHLLPFLQEDRYHFVEEMFTHHNDDAAPRQHPVYSFK
jgi:hypothetical protein